MRAGARSGWPSPWGPAMGKGRPGQHVHSLVETQVNTPDITSSRDSEIQMFIQYDRQRY